MDKIETINNINKIRNPICRMQSNGVTEKIDATLNNILEQLEILENEFIVCQECGYIIHYTEAQELNNKYYCDECIKNIKIQ